MQQTDYKSFIDWERETAIGNQYFNKKHFEKAIKNYLYAKKLASQLFNSSNNPERAVSALVVSYHNLADLYKQKNELKMAYQELDEVDAYLVNCLENGITNAKKMNAVRRGIDKTRAELLSFIQRNKITLAYNNIVSGNKSTH